MATFWATGVRGVDFGYGVTGYYNDSFGRLGLSPPPTADFISWARDMPGSFITPPYALPYTITDRFYGRFVYDSPASYNSTFASGGTVTGYDQVADGQVLVSSANLNIAVPSGDRYESIANVIVAGNDDITGSGFRDRLYGGVGNDYIRGLDGDDLVGGGLGDDDINGNQGSDQMFGEAGADWARGGQGNDTVRGGDGDDPHVNGNLGDDVVWGEAGADTVFGGQGNDFVRGAGFSSYNDGDDLVSGDLGNDSLYGDSGADTLLGGGGDDLLSGDAGADILFGGAGADRFVLAKGGGRDWIGDFNATEGDRIVLAPDTTYVASSSSGQVLIELGTGDVIGLAGVPSASFSADWIVFA